MNEMNELVGSWGDMGDGTYRNPILFADYSDPDCIRVGDDYWMICSEFHYMGMPVLHSKDLVNWELAGRVYTRMDGYDELNRYGQGSWAPSIRYHDGLFYIYFCTPKDGLFMTTAEDPRGPWAPLHCVHAGEGWEDPCPFWDDDGRAYLGHSVLGANYLYLHEMTPDGKTLLDDGVLVYEGHHAEGTKIYKHDGLYYYVVPEGHVSFGYETALRSASLYGPFERKVVLSQGDSWVNGPHQGALVDTPNGEWWFLHFSSTGTAGRIVHLQPAHWENGWPMIDGPVLRHQKPALPEGPLFAPKTSDDFASPELGLQWQWNHNPVDCLWSLTENPQHLRLYGTNETEIRKMPNVLTQRLTGSCGTVRVTLDMTGASVGQRGGLVLFGRAPACLEAVRTENGVKLWKQYGREWVEIPRTVITLFLSLQYMTEQHLFLVTDSPEPDEALLPLSEHAVADGDWKGARIGLFTGEGEGYVDFSDFIYRHDGPAGRIGR